MVREGPGEGRGTVQGGCVVKERPGGGRGTMRTRVRGEGTHGVCGVREQCKVGVCKAARVG